MMTKLKGWGLSVLAVAITSMAQPVSGQELNGGNYEIKEINGGQKVKLTGKVDTLRIGLVDGASTLDASGLEAGEVEFYDKIDGRSTVNVKALKGSITFQKKVDGRSKVTARGKDVEFKEKIDGGPETIVKVDATGNLSFMELNGGARLYYKKNKGLNISAGKLDNPNSKFEGRDEL
jgi:hypothetical protein